MSQNNGAGEVNDNANCNADEIIRELSKTILSKQELNVEAFIYNIATILNASGGGGNAEENNQAVQDLAEEKMAEFGVLINHKFSGILKEYLVQLEEKRKGLLFSSICLPDQDIQTSSLNYRDCFEAWTSSPYVSYKTTNVLHLGKLSAKDCLLLHVFTFLTCYRVKGDNLFAICFSGASTVGKTTLWENPLYENAHSYVNDNGVGRWSVKKKNLLFYHDINVNALIKGKDSDKFKTISRTEVTVCKVFGKTEVLPPLFVCITSNMRVHNHQCIQESTSKQTMSKYINYKSQLQLSGDMSQIHEIVNAVQNRIVECYVSKRPALDVTKLPQTGNFTRMNAILGMYNYVVGILEHCTVDSFFSIALLSYVLTGLVDNFVHFNQIMPCALLTKQRLINVIYNIHKEDIKLCEAYINRLS